MEIHFLCIVRSECDTYIFDNTDGNFNSHVYRNPYSDNNSHPTATPTLASNNGYFLSPEYDFRVSNNGNQYGYYVLDFPQPNAQFVGYFLWTSHNISFLENIPLIDPNVPNVILGGSSIFGHGSNWYCYGIETQACPSASVN